MNGQFRACAQALQANFPGLKIEGGPYTPPPYIQHTIRALTGVQMLVPGLYFFGEQLFGLIGRAPPEVVASMHANPIMALGAFFGVHALQSTLKSINAFEITYNGNVLHSKIKSGKFPAPAELTQSLRQIMAKEKPPSSGDDAPPRPRERAAARRGAPPARLLTLTPPRKASHARARRPRPERRRARAACRRHNLHGIRYTHRRESEMFYRG